MTPTDNNEEPPALKMLELLKKVIEEVLDCHCHYNQHDHKGNELDIPVPKLLAKLSPSVSEITIPQGNSFFSRFSRKIFFIHAVSTSIPKVAEINAEAHKNQRETLERVKSHILSPLWWTNNTSHFKFSIIRASQNFAHGLQEVGRVVLNGLKSGFNVLVSDKNHIEISPPPIVEASYNRTAMKCEEN